MRLVMGVKLTMKFTTKLEHKLKLVVTKSQRGKCVLIWRYNLGSKNAALK